MMLKAIAVFAVLALACANDDNYYWFQYGKFISEYRAGAELGAAQSRFEIFKDNLKYIEAHNSLDHPYELGVNQFADMTNEEFRNTMLGLAGNETTIAEAHIADPNEVVANDVDWTNTLPPVKNQGSCGSCWAFSAVAAIEGRKGGVSLSEQQLVDCSSENNGCNGGLMSLAFDYIKSAGGEDSEKSYPYTARDGSCHFDKSAVQAKVTGYKSVNGEDALVSALNSGVVSVAIDAGSRDFQMYKSGVFTGSCGSALNHGVAAVGYKSGEYYIVRNSWGTTWGDKGYIKMVMGKSICGIATQMSCYPTVA